MISTEYLPPEKPIRVQLVTNRGDSYFTDIIKVTVLDRTTVLYEGEDSANFRIRAVLPNKYLIIIHK